MTTMAHRKPKPPALRLREPGTVSLDLVGVNGRSRVGIKVRADSKESARCVANRVRELLVAEVLRPKCLRER